MSVSEGAGRSVWRLGGAAQHTLVVAPREQLAGPSAVQLPPPEPAPGLILPDGSINWGCPCLGGMATGPCGAQFREAFSCFHYSEAEPKGSDCYEKFSVMQDCMAQFPQLYDKDDDDDPAGALQAADPPAADPPAVDAPAAPQAADAPRDAVGASH
ncbi:mitochondrial intermembrane space import and assembly protein 40-B [Pararge aegeria]|uniref:mitochondrial intermembrane space import and assembly protein 40-B n=1 Tax=Pararge aegeria TaxID=116150 RepID=UPI0019D17C28|nr:mitochondrial intermembrane space import and assembly protein 40-B [Pararge aegeria]XP_039758092.1 mitochondrial intermembrane space import and assembly protein 40-B [Pararge aegeria]